MLVGAIIKADNRANRRITDTAGLGREFAEARGARRPLESDVIHFLGEIHAHGHECDPVGQAVHAAHHMHLHRHVCRHDPQGRWHHWRIGEGVFHRRDNLFRREAVCSVPVSGHVHIHVAIRGHPLAFLVAMVSHDADRRVVRSIGDVATIAFMGGSGQGGAEQSGAREELGFHCVSHRLRGRWCAKLQD